MSSNNETAFIDSEGAKILLELAGRSIKNGLEKGSAWHPDLVALPPALKANGASFVTLKLHGELRGCIGTLEARLPLATDVAHNAFESAFHDPRFPSVTEKEFPSLEIHISILTPPQPMSFESEEDFLGQLRPGRDGIILAEGYRRGTFLPAVWEELPKPKDFFRYLKMKAGLPQDYWSKTIKAFRYETQYIP